MEIFEVDFDAFPWKHSGMEDAHHAQGVHTLADLVTTSESAEKLATEVGCSPSHVLNIRDGRKNASLPLAKKLSDATGLPMDAFMRQPEAAQ